MRLRTLLLMLGICVLGIGCAGETETSSETTATNESEASEAVQTYELRGVVVDRDPMANTLKVAHEEIGDWMGAMTMSFPVRGDEVQNLPADGASITATVNVDDTEFWLSEVAIAEETAEDTDTADQEDASEAEEAPEQN